MWWDFQVSGDLGAQILKKFLCLSILLLLVQLFIFDWSSRHLTLAI